MNVNSPRKMESRITHCTNCGQTFTYRYQTIYTLGENLTIKMSCPFCTTKLTLDLSSYATKKIVSYKSVDGNPGSNEAIMLDLPLELPTAKGE